MFDDDAKKDNCSLKTSRNFWRVAWKNVEEHVTVPGYETWSKRWAGKESGKSYKEKTIDKYILLFQSKNSSNNNSTQSGSSYNNIRSSAVIVIILVTVIVLKVTLIVVIIMLL